MTLSEQIHKNLIDGSWVFDDLGHLFQDQLSNKLNLQKLNKNTSELCLAHYKNVQLDKLNLNSESKGLYNFETNLEISKVIRSIFSNEYPEMVMISFEKDESEKIENALKFINTLDNQLYDMTVKNINLFLRLQNTNFRSASHPHLYGIMLIGDGIADLTSEQLAVSIIHELAHQELFLINLVDRLVHQPFDNNEIHAPLQGKKRPPIGRLHSLWALYRMVRFQSSMGKPNSKHRDMLLQNVKSFEKGELTKMGKALVQIVYEKAA